MKLCPQSRAGWERLGVLLGLSLLCLYPITCYVSDHSWRILGRSMLPTLENRSRVFTIWEKDVDEIERGDIVIVNVHDRQLGWQRWVKRAVGLPGDTIRITAGAGYVLVNGVPLSEPYLDPTLVSYVEGGTWVVGEGEIFVLGDNRGNSADSREIGPVKLENVETVLGVYIQF